MAQDFDDFPVYDRLLHVDNVHLSSEWTDFFGTFFNNLIGYLSSFGIFIPIVTLAQRNTIQSPQNGQMIYNSDNNTIQVWVNGAWKTVTVT